MVEYNKTPLTYQQHLDLLESRGLTISNPEEAVNFLKQVNYYRFTAYCIPFQKPRDVFIEGSTFKRIVELYRLDEELRSAVFAALTPVEIFLRTRTAYELCHRYGTFAQYELSVYQNKKEGNQWLAELEEDTRESKEPFLQHYREKYKGFPRLPFWMAVEIMGLGSLSKFYSNLTLENRNLICSIDGIDHNVFKTWLHTITFLRNICAHHGRLWSRNFSIRPKIPDKDPDWKKIPFNNKKLFTTIAVLEWICRKAELPVNYIEPVFETMNRISALDGRFSGWMGVPVSRVAEWCWEADRD
jgi:abortive infection bacteriophage resistance protein